MTPTQAQNALDAAWAKGYFETPIPDDYPAKGYSFQESNYRKDQALQLLAVEDIARMSDLVWIESQRRIRLAGFWGADGEPRKVDRNGHGLPQEEAISWIRVLWMKFLRESDVPVLNWEEV